MKKYRVTVKYGKPGEFKHSTQQITVEAESDSSAMQLAVSKFKNSNPAYRNMDAEAVQVQQI
jgi:hypothetical protein